MSKTLLLTLHKKAFDVMVTGEKGEEFRTFTDWIASRLFDKNFEDREYDEIKFVNGYGHDKPFFICKYKGWRFIKPFEHNQVRRYSNGLTIALNWTEMIIIICGEIIERGNIKTHA